MYRGPVASLLSLRCYPSTITKLHTTTVLLAVILDSLLSFTNLVPSIGIIEGLPPLGDGIEVLSNELLVH